MPLTPDMLPRLMAEPLPGSSSVNGGAVLWQLTSEWQLPCCTFVLPALYCLVPLPVSDAITAVNLLLGCKVAGGGECIAVCSTSAVPW